MSERQVVGSPRWVPGWGIGPIFFTLATVFMLIPDHGAAPAAETPPFDRALLTTSPSRRPIQDPPMVRVNGFDRTCMDCHRLFKSANDDPRALNQHVDVRMAHGPNIRCGTCHDWDDRDRLKRLDGTTQGFADSTALCAQCHQRKHEDWTCGIHGRSNGHWDESRGERRRLSCTECHDPHQPRHGAMTPIRPLPGPHTLRMGDGHVPPHGDEEDPLQRAFGNAGHGVQPRGEEHK